MDRTAQVLDAAALEARQHGLAFITRNGVAKRAGVPPGSMCLFGDMADIKEEVARMDPSLNTGGPLDRNKAARSETDEAILTAAVGLAATGRYDRLTRQDIASRAGVSPGRVSLLAGNMAGLRDAIMNEAVRQGVASVVAQGLADRHPAALAAPEDLRREALAVLAVLAG